MASFWIIFQKLCRNLDFVLYLHRIEWIELKPPKCSTSWKELLVSNELLERCNQICWMKYLTIGALFIRIQRLVIRMRKNSKNIWWINNWNSVVFCMHRGNFSQMLFNIWNMPLLLMGISSIGCRILKKNLQFLFCFVKI